MKQHLFEKIIARLKETRIGKLFLDKKFAHYTWIGIFISVLNIFLLWLFIDVFRISTLISSSVVIGSTFIVRYVLLRRFETL